jgi:hypothetical protein
LFDRRSSKGVRGHEKAGVAVRFEPVGHFCGGRCLPGAIDSHDEDCFRFRGKGCNWRRSEGQDFQDFPSANFSGGFGVNFASALAQRVKDAQGHRHAEVGAHERFFQFVPVHWLGGELCDKISQEPERHGL